MMADDGADGLAGWVIHGEAGSRGVSWRCGNSQFPSRPVARLQGCGGDGPPVTANRGRAQRYGRLGRLAARAAGPRTGPRARSCRGLALLVNNRVGEPRLAVRRLGRHLRAVFDVIPAAGAGSGGGGSAGKEHEQRQATESQDVPEAPEPAARGPAVTTVGDGRFSPEGHGDLGVNVSLPVGRSITLMLIAKPSRYKRFPRFSPSPAAPPEAPALDPAGAVRAAWACSVSVRVTVFFRFRRTHPRPGSLY
jgi:hypothetical protein